MNKATKKVKDALISRYKAQGFVVPVAMRERPLRTQFRAFTKDAAAQAKPLPTPDPMNPMGQVDPMMAGQLLGQALDMSGTPDPMQEAQMQQEAAMQQQMAAQMAATQPQMAGMAPQAGPQPMMAPEQLPAQPGAAQAQTRVPAQPGPGINSQQILAALFGGR
jgi:hypothetical protein